MTQKQIILQFLRDRDWTPSYQLEKVSTPYGWIGTSGGRRCRELHEAGLLERKIEGRYVYYRLNSQRFRKVIYKVDGKIVAEVIEEI